MSGDMVAILITFVIYLFFMLFIGWYFYKRTSNLSDYILGGRGLNSWVTSMSAQASDMSGWLLLGLPGYAYLAGLESAWLLLGLITGTYLNWKFVAERLRKYTFIAGNSITLPDYFENRFRTKSHLLRMISAIFILIFFLIYTSSGFVAGAKLFSSVFDLPYWVALLSGVFVIIAYTFLGGFMAVSWTDLIQGTIMFFAIILVPIAGVMELGGIEATTSAIAEKNINYFGFFTNVSGESLSIIAVVSLLAWGLGYFGQPHILARFMAIKKSTMISKSRHIAMVWSTVSLIAAVALGMIGYVLISPELNEVTSETVFMVMVQELIHPLLAGSLLAAILAAIMSTADSQLLVASSALTEDLYRFIIKRKISEEELVFVSRLAVILIAVIAFFIALDPSSSVLDLVAYAWAGFGATFGPLVLFSLYWKRMTAEGAIWGIITGGITVVVWKQLSGGVFDMYEIVPGFIVSVLAIIIISLNSKEPSQEILEEFEKVNVFEE